MSRLSGPYPAPQTERVSEMATMPTEPRISCLLPVYNGEQFLDEAIRSILAQTYANFELVIVDDGSRDSTPDILKGLAAEDARVKIVRRENGGA